MNDIKTEPIIAKVEVTSDYGKFKFMAANRAVNKKHVQDLIASFEKNPRLVSTRPILVNENMEVIDGQHRLQACEALGWPIQYIVSPGLDISTAQLMNVLQKPWTAMDYARSYSIAGVRAYQDFLRYYEEYPIALTPLMTYLSGKQAKLASRDFRGGKFELAADRAQVDRQLDQLSTFEKYLPQHWRLYSFGMAFWHVVNRVENYDHNRMLKQLELAKLDPQSSRVDYIRALERVYNYNKGATSQVRFF